MAAPARGRYNEPVGTDRTTRALIGLAVGSLGALGAAAALVGVRGEIANANVAVGLVVGEIAVRSQTIHALRTDHRAQLRRINRIAGLAAKGELVDDLLLAVTAELIDTLRLRDAYFERRLIAIALADQVGAVLGRKAA